MPETTWSPRWAMQDVAVQQAEQHRHRDGGEQPERGAAGERGHAAGGERAGEHLALEADVHHPGALADEARVRGEQERHGDAKGREREGTSAWWRGSRAQHPREPRSQQERHRPRGEDHQPLDRPPRGRR